MKTTEVTFLSADGKTTIHGWIKEPSKVANGKQLPRAVIQIVHGIAEHIGRYEQLSRHLVDQGFVVCAHDQIGHGRSVADKDELGHIPATDGPKILTDDVHSMRKLVQPRYLQSVPYVLFGHSMGSFVTRLYVSYPEGNVDAAVFSGTDHPEIWFTVPKLFFARSYTRRHGERNRSDYMYKKGIGRLNKKIKKPRTECDWICTDPNVVDAYIADPLSGFRPTNGAFLTMATMIREMLRTDVYTNTPKELFIYCVSGSADPMSEKGQVPLYLARSYARAKHINVTPKTVEGARHEVFNEPNWKRSANEMIAWMARCLGV